VSLVPADTDSLSLFPPGNISAELIDDARDFVAWNTGILHPGPPAFFGEHVAMTNSAGLHLYAHLPSARLGNLALDDLEISSRLANLRRFHWRSPESRCCHDVSFEFEALPMFPSTKTRFSAGATSESLKSGELGTTL